MYADLEILFHVSNQCFYPVPAVQSSLLRLVFRDEPRYPVKDEAFFRLLVRASFAQRRKTLLNNLKSFRHIEITTEEIGAILSTLAIDGSRRAEFAALSNALIAGQ
jgi:16S rRNA (adenine1518-N6/adenine1519-N6)-dimethyltransferase